MGKTCSTEIVNCHARSLFWKKNHVWHLDVDGQLVFKEVLKKDVRLCDIYIHLVNNLLQCSALVNTIMNSERQGIAGTAGWLLASQKDPCLMEMMRRRRKRTRRSPHLCNRHKSVTCGSCTIQLGVLTSKTLPFRLHNVFVCSAWSITSLHSTNHLTVVSEMRHFLRKAGTKFLNFVFINFRFQRLVQKKPPFLSAI